MCAEWIRPCEELPKDRSRVLYVLNSNPIVFSDDYEEGWFGSYREDKVAAWT